MLMTHHGCISITSLQPIHFPMDDRSPENVNPIEQKEKHPKLHKPTKLQDYTKYIFLH